MSHPEKRAKWAGRSLVTSVLVLVGVVTWLATQDLAQNEKLQGVDRAAPCRTLGPDAKECRRQSRLIVKSCLTHKPCRKLVVRLTSGPNTLPQSDKPDSRKVANPQPGGDAQQPPSQAPQQPGPPSGGPPPGGNGNPPGNPPKPPEPGALDPVLDPACELTEPLNLC